jgi:hypothetical protein
VSALRCDADPGALAKYVVALIKKEKPEAELRDSMEQQMEVFLQESTDNFIEELFGTLSNKEYLDGPPKVVAKKETKSEVDEETSILEEGKPDSTTSTPANISDLSDLKEGQIEYKPSRHLSDVIDTIIVCLFVFTRPGGTHDRCFQPVTRFLPSLGQNPPRGPIKPRVTPPGGVRINSSRCDTTPG